MTPWVHPDSSDDLIELMIAVDEMMTANTAAQVALGQYCPDVDPRSFDMSKLAYFLELFARDAAFTSETIHGDRAVVAVQVAGRLPLRNLEFCRHEGRWVYMPGEVNRELVQGIRDLAKGLTRFAGAIATGARTPQQLNSEFRYRVASRFDVFMPEAVPTTAPSQRNVAAASLPS
ncbi:MAG: hypothetical protein QUV05_12385 [Phycisphaerae bacterium]|nr:hypothetical protein [Phycisphaerae bacterium]